MVASCLCTWRVPVRDRAASRKGEATQRDCVYPPGTGRRPAERRKRREVDVVEDKIEPAQASSEGFRSGSEVLYVLQMSGGVL